MTPRFLNGTRSPATNMLMVRMAPPPSPAIARPMTKIHSLLATPQRSVPIPKAILDNSRPRRLPKMSVSRPLRGWVTDWPMRYAEPIHDRVLRYENELEIATRRVATIVESAQPVDVVTRIFRALLGNQNKIHTDRR